MEVTNVPPQDVTRLDPYDAVVLGSAVYMGRWLPEAADFAERHRSALRDRQVWLFSSGPLGDPPIPAGQAAQLPPLIERLGAQEHRTFAGALRDEGLGLKEHLIVKVVKAPYGDFRDWAAIDSWADEIAHALTSVAVG
jgi:menaquinone-dependent protoporphyrinogen oxidase